MTSTRDTGALLNHLWDVRAAHALYIHDGHWYHQLKSFPGALFDRHGYVRFETEAEYRSCPYLQIGKQISVPKRISSIPGYIKVRSYEAALAFAAIEATPFDPSGIEDARKRIVHAIVQRQGQIAFRSRLLIAYEYACCVTDADALPALEAAHIYPYHGKRTNHVTNGILLRADLHTLFDQGLLCIDGTTLTVLVAPAVMNTVYRSISGRTIRLPRKFADHPSRTALDWHRREHGL